MTNPRVTVSATARREVPPDRFTFSAAVSGVDADVRAARAALAARYVALEQALAELPESAEVRPGELTTWPEGVHPEQRWRVHRGVTVLGDDVTVVGDVLAALVRAPDAELDGPRWSLRPDHPVHSELQTEVVRLARERAERYATALGGTLGRLVELRDPEGGGWYAEAVPVAAAFGRARPDVDDLDFQPVAVTVHAAITATWSLVLPE
jgi:uncharacterized protein YggE